MLIFNCCKTGSGGDNPPVITGCPGTALGVVEPGTNFGRATWTPPQATDDDGLPVRVGQTHAPNSLFPLGQTEVRYFFGDSTGNAVACLIIVTITGNKNEDLTNLSAAFKVISAGLYKSDYNNTCCFCYRFMSYAHTHDATLD